MSFCFEYNTNLFLADKIIDEVQNYLYFYNEVSSFYGTNNFVQISYTKFNEDVNAQDTFIV